MFNFLTNYPEKQITVFLRKKRVTVLFLRSMLLQLLENFSVFVLKIPSYRYDKYHKIRSEESKRELRRDFTLILFLILKFIIGI